MTETDARLAARLADQAGALLLDLRHSSSMTGKNLGKRGDLESNAFLLRELATARPGDVVLSEEAKDSAARGSADRVWIIDPLDGTREYSMPPRSDWAVHVALWQRERGITDAAVSQPSLGAVYATDTVRIQPASRSVTPVLLVSESRPPEFADAIAKAVGAELRPMGSAGAKAMAVLRGEAAAYVHAGGQWEWDSAAPVGVALAAGMHVSRIDGSPLAYNRDHPYLPDLVISETVLATPLLAAIRDATAR